MCGVLGGSVCRYSDGVVRVWDVKTGACVVTLNGHKGAITALTFQPKVDSWPRAPTTPTSSCGISPPSPASSGSFNTHTHVLVGFFAAEFGLVSLLMLTLVLV